MVTHMYNSVENDVATYLIRFSIVRCSYRRERKECFLISIYYNTVIAQLALCIPTKKKTKKNKKTASVFGGHMDKAVCF